MRYDDNHKERTRARVLERCRVMHPIPINRREFSAFARHG
jgi:hypothetical protein